MENKDIMAKARESLKGHWGIAIGAILLNGIIVYGIQIIPVVGAIISLLIGGAMALGLNTIMLALARNEETKIGHLFDGFSRFGTALAALLLQTLFIILWMLLLIIPGLIAAYSYAMTFYVLADNKSTGALEAIKKSKEMMQGNKWKLFCLSFRFFGWVLLALLTLGIGFIWLIPYMSVSFAIFYNDIKSTQSEKTFLA
ncbi:MAG: DUF975 family protein [Pseudomonadota bacterium]